MERRGPVRLFAALLPAAAFLAAASLRSLADPGEKVFAIDDALHFALLNNAKLLGAEQEKVIAEERVQEAEYLFLPEFGLQGSATKYDARYPFAIPDTSLLLFPKNFGGLPADTGDLYSGVGYMRVSLYDGGRTLNTLRLAQAGQRQAETVYSSVRLDIVSSVKEIFYRLLLAQERAEAARGQTADVERLFKTSSFSAWEKLQAEDLLGQARTRAAEAEHSLQMTRLSFLKALNIEYDTPFSIQGELKTKPLGVDVEKAVLWALELRPELQSETYRAEMDSIAVNLAAARRLPTVFLSGDYSVIDQRFPLEQNNWDATVGLKIPFTYDYWSLLREKRAEQRQGQLKRADLQDKVRLEVRQAYEDLRYWQQEWPSREKLYLDAKALYAGAAAQSGASLEKMRAFASLTDLHIAYLTAVTEHLIAKVKLEQAVGRELE